MKDDGRALPVPPTGAPLPCLVFLLPCQECDSDACVGYVCAAVLTLKPDRLELKAAREAKAAAKAAALEQQQQLAQQQQQLGQAGAGGGAGAAGADGGAGLVYLLRRENVATTSPD